jgi:hypothetical protein
VIPEGDEDAVYVVVRRDVDGSSVRYVERLQTRLFDALEDAFFVDSGLTFDGTNTGATTMTVTGGTAWDSTEELTITASVATFAFPAQTDAGDEIVLYDGDDEYRLAISSTTSTTVAKAYVDNTLPVALRSTATAIWAFARDTMSGLSHLEGCTVSILGDGAVHPQQDVASGVISLDRPCVKVVSGLPITADIQTLPVAIGLKDGSYGQGYRKNINKAWLRVYRSSGIFIGPDADNLVEAKQRTTEPYGSPPDLKSEEIEVVAKPSWGDSGQVFVRQSDPLPLTVVSLTVEVAWGG